MSRLAVRLSRRKVTASLLFTTMLWEEEIVALHAAGKVTRENAAKLLRKFEQLDRETELDPEFSAAQGRARHWNHP